MFMTTPILLSEQRTLWDQYKLKWFVPCIEVVLFKRFQLHYIDRGDKIWGFSFVHCGEVFNTVSLSRSVVREILLYRHKKRGAGIFKRWHGWAKQTLSSLIFCN